MKVKVPDMLEKGRVQHGGAWKSSPGDWYGAFFVKGPGVERLTLIVSRGDDWDFEGLPPPAWEHVSVSLQHRCPTWEEMDYVKNLCWDKDECVVQFHPPRKDWVSFHPYTLHLWKPVGIELPRPPKACVGPQMSRDELLI